VLELVVGMVQDMEVGMVQDMVEGIVEDMVQDRVLGRVREPVLERGLVVVHLEEEVLVPQQALVRGLVREPVQEPVPLLPLMIQRVDLLVVEHQVVEEHCPADHQHLVDFLV